MRVLLVTPPMTQLNTPYPATAYLMGCLRKHAADAVEVAQADLSIELFLRLFSRDGLTAVQAELNAARGRKKRFDWFLSRWETYAALVEPVVRFLQGHDPSLAMRIAGRAFLPEGPRFASLDAESGDGEELLGWAFGELGVTDRARHLASLFVDDLADVIRDGIDPRFELSRYGEKLASSAARFDPLADALDAPPTLVDRLLDELARDCVRAHAPDVVGLTVPFPGNLYGALRIARVVKAERPAAKVVLGGGYVNTELRQLGDAARVRRLRLHHARRRRAARSGPRRSPARSGPPAVSNVRARGGRRGPQVDAGARRPAPPRHRDADVRRAAARSLRLAVRDAEPDAPAVGGRALEQADRRARLLLEAVHVLRRVAGLHRALRAGVGGRHRRSDRGAGARDGRDAGSTSSTRRRRPRCCARSPSGSSSGRSRSPGGATSASRRRFTPELVELLARSGCVAVSGGLEVASDRLLELMKKGVTVEQVARVARAFTDAGVMVHAYLMYGFPTETAQETVDALERVRQLFAEGCIQSAFWHRFAATAHSPIGREPERLRHPPRARAGRARQRMFARNELPFVDPTGCDHERFGPGLRRALYNFMHGVGLEQDVRRWFAPEAKAAAPEDAGAGKRGRRSRSRRSRPI